MNQLFFLQSDPPKKESSKTLAPQSLVLKIWYEELNKAQKPQWRIRLTHVDSGDYYYVSNLWGLFFLILQFLKKTGAELPLAWRLMMRVSSPYLDKPPQKPPDDLLQ